MKLKIIISALIFTVFCTVNSFAQNTQVVIEITNVVINNGKVFLAIFSNANEFRNEEPPYVYELESTSTTLSQEITLPVGEYVISAFQDTNNNQRLDFGLFGIPRELVGISNYFGRGFPSRNFDRQKILINTSTEKIVIGLYRF